MSHKETIQKIVSDQSGGLSDLQAGLEHRIQQLANLCDGQGRQVEQNTAKLAAIMADVNRDFDGVRQELANFKVNILEATPLEAILGVWSGGGWFFFFGGGEIVQNKKALPSPFLN